ncbi:putative Ig domain-containing protein, partial [candidate division KSB1 bacterium]
EAYQDSLYTYQVTASDSAGDTLVYSLQTAPEGMGIDSLTGLISWTPSDDDHGSKKVIVAVSDGTNEVTQDFKINVRKNKNSLSDRTDDDLKITSIPGNIAVHDSLYTYQVIAVSLDTSAILAFSLVRSPEGMEIDDSTGLVTWTPSPDEHGAKKVEIMVSDSVNTATQSFKIVVFKRTPPGFLHTIAHDTVTVEANFMNQGRARIKFRKNGKQAGDTLRITFYDNTEPGLVTTDDTLETAVVYLEIETDTTDTIGEGFEADITIEYTDEQIEGSGIDDENKLTIAYFNEEDSTWVQQETTVDTANNTATTSTTHFSIWVLADENNFTVSQESAVQITGIEIAPQDTVVNIGTSFTFNTIAFDTNQIAVDTTFTWSISDSSVGTIDSTGLFTAVNTGSAYVIITIDSWTDSALITVIDTSVSGAINTVTIQKMLPNGNLHNKVNVIQEGGREYKFSGFPSPLNFLNGGRLMFPAGSLSEDIKITIKLPQLANIRGDSVARFQSPDTTKVVASGAEFNVTVDGDTVSPYYFDSPVSVSLPYKRGLLNELGLNPEDLSAAFYSDTAGLDTTGITNAVIDSSRNRIIVDVAHFSTIVLYGENIDITTEVEELNSISQIPTNYSLKQNYPNPFNPETRIKYQIPVPTRVTIKIFNLLGQEIITLIDREQFSGSYELIWDGRNSLGTKVSSGIYIYQMRTKEFIKFKKMVLIK